MEFAVMWRKIRDVKNKVNLFLERTINKSCRFSKYETAFNT